MYSSISKQLLYKCETKNKFNNNNCVKTFSISFILLKTVFSITVGHTNGNTSKFVWMILKISFDGMYFNFQSLDSFKYSFS